MLRERAVSILKILPRIEIESAHDCEKRRRLKVWRDEQRVINAHKRYKERENVSVEELSFDGDLLCESSVPRRVRIVMRGSTIIDLTSLASQDWF